MKAYMSKPDSGVRNLQPLRYQSDRDWLSRTAVAEAQAILADVQPLSPGWGTIELCPVEFLSADEREILRESLAAFLED